MSTLRNDQDVSAVDFVATGHNEQQPPAAAGAGAAREERPAPLFGENEAQELRGRWSEIQTTFVDEPRHAVEEADRLVDVTVKRISESFAKERAKLEEQWGRGDNISTEDLRVALQRYRSFFNRLLSV